MNTNAENNPSSQGFSKPSKDTADASASASHAWRISSFEDIRDLPASSVVPEEPSKARRSPTRSKKKPARESLYVNRKREEPQADEKQAD